MTETFHKLSTYLNIIRLTATQTSDSSKSNYVRRHYMVLEENMAALSLSNSFCPVKKVLKQKSYRIPLWESFEYFNDSLTVHHSIDLFQ